MARLIGGPCAAWQISRCEVNGESIDSGALMTGVTPAQFPICRITPQLSTITTLFSFFFEKQVSVTFLRCLKSRGFCCFLSREETVRNRIFSDSRISKTRGILRLTYSLHSSTTESQFLARAVATTGELLMIEAHKRSKRLYSLTLVNPSNFKRSC